jgi:hypothetical protein
MLAGLELSIAPFTHTDNRGRGFFNDPQASIRHEPSLPQSGGAGFPVEIKRHHHPITASLAQSANQQLE